MSKHILVIGGAGYIGSHTVKALDRAGYIPVVFDNLSTGHAEFLRWGKYIIGDLADAGTLRKAFAEYDISAVMLFAAFTDVGESVTNPGKYYTNNVANTLNLLNIMREFGVRHVAFSSTCAVYGNPLRLPLTEDHPREPINPYGRTKLAVEWMLEDFASAYDFSYTALRYFNAAGADPEGGIGEWHEPETHLIPLVLAAAKDPTRHVKIFGEDYDTPSGTCIRDYVHVNDLADAHILAFERLQAGGPSAAFNLGNGAGFSVREVIECARKVTGKPIDVRTAPRRPGDPAMLVGSSERACKELGWKPRHADLETIVRTAWEWEQTAKVVK